MVTSEIPGMLYESHGADLFLRNYFFKEVYNSIKEYQDAYGAELRTFLETGAKIEIVERDDGYIDYNEGIPYYFAPYEEWADYEKEAIEYAFGRTKEPDGKFLNILIAKMPHI